MELKEMTEHPRKNDYMLLARLQADCEYFLGYGNRNVKRLWAGEVGEQIEKMKELYNSFVGEDIPTWISLKKINDYEKRMKEKNRI